MTQTAILEKVLKELEGLAEDRIQEVLDFIRFLKSRQEGLPPLSYTEALKILAELDRIRAEAEARFGVYPGDPVREVREERERYMEKDIGVDWVNLVE